MMGVTLAETTAAVLEENTQVPSSLSEFWFFFRQNRAALLGLAVVGVFVLIALLAPWLAPYDPALIHDGAFKLPPVWYAGGVSQHLLGTDDVGRDLLSRLIYGARISMGVGFLVVVFSLSIGTLLGLFAGYLTIRAGAQSVR